MEFSEKLTALRRREGMSQEQLADRLGVTRQSVSKWESGAVMPELVKLIALSEMFGVSVDYLVKDWLEERGEAEPDTPDSPFSAQQAARLEQKVDDLTRSINGSVYRYDSRTRILGLPLVSVRIGFVRHYRMSRDDVARGVIAIGNAAVGVVSIGIVSVGLFSFGCLAAGLLSLGIVALGLGAFGVAALGYLAFGVSAVGFYAGGVCAAGADIAVGVAAASANTAVGCEAEAPHVLLWGAGLRREAVEAFLLERHPGLWRPLLRFLGAIGGNLQ
ncbi:MAG: helix-turn-helix transcriptional regulator [Oscillospiraceae bacterium]|nr:helix-turn-helix transcriptional regulator [Oscillospiraceae bacterium]